MALRLRSILPRSSISNIRSCSSKPPNDNLPSNPEETKKIAIPPRTKCHIARHKTESELLKIPYTSTLTSHYQNPQNLVKIPYVKPYESTYVCNRPIEDPVKRITDQMKPFDKRETKYYIEGYTAHYGRISCTVNIYLIHEVDL